MINTRRTIARSVKENDVNEGFLSRDGQVTQGVQFPQGIQSAQGHQVYIFEGGNQV